MKRLPRALMLLLFVFSPAGSGGAPQNPRTPDGAIQKLGAFAGKWKSSGEMKDSAQSKAGAKVSSEMSCDWTANHGFLLCDQIIHTPSGDQNDLSIYTYSEKDHAYAFFGITRGQHEARTTDLTIDGSLWTYSSSEIENGKRIQYRTTNRFTSETYVAWRSEYSQDGQQWTTMAEGSDLRVN